MSSNRGPEGYTTSADSSVPSESVSFYLPGRGGISLATTPHDRVRAIELFEQIGAFALLRVGQIIHLAYYFLSDLVHLVLFSLIKSLRLTFLRLLVVLAH